MNTINNIQERLVANLITLRKAKGLTQIELGQKINYSDKTISKWEKGDSCPNIEAIYKIARFYEITVDDLLSEDLQAEQTIGEQRQRTYGKLIISLLAIIAVWTIATIIFVYLSLLKTEAPWLMFVFAVPESAVVALVFNSIWGNRRKNYLIISILLWSLLASIYLCCLKYSMMWVIFFIGIPVQIAIILWSQLKYSRKKKKVKAKAVEEKASSENLEQ